MLYYFYEWNQAMLAPLRAAADATRIAYQNPLNPASRTTVGRAIAAGAELFERTTRVYAKPSFDLTETVVGHTHVRVEEKVVVDKPFCRLLHFERQLPKDRASDPRFLIVAPLSGHHSTLLRGTVEALLPYADVYITDWKDAREVPVEEGKFDLDDYAQYVIDFLHFLGPDSHVLGVCQPSVPVMMAVAHMEKQEDDCYPATMTLMGGPIDTRVNPTAVNRLAVEKGIDWFRENVIMTVPFPQPGFRRRVYPGFLQLTGFMSMNLDRHMMAHKDFFWHLVKDDGDSAEKHRTFYDEYNAVMDMTAEFYLQTVEEVFIKHSLPKGEMKFHGETIDLGAIKRVALLTVEGENDDISGVGQTEAAQDICPNIPEEMRVHYVQPKVGHYGVFNGSRFRSEIVPRIVDFALTHGTTHGSAKLPKKTEITKREGRNFGAFAERRAKASTLGQSLGAGGETGIADPLMFESNPFAAGERMMRAFAEPAEKAIAETMKQATPAKKSAEASKAPAAAPSEKKAAEAKSEPVKQETAETEPAKTESKTDAAPQKEHREATAEAEVKTEAAAKGEPQAAETKAGTAEAKPAAAKASDDTAKSEAKAAEAEKPDTETKASAKADDKKPETAAATTTDKTQSASNGTSDELKSAETDSSSAKAAGAIPAEQKAEAKAPVKTGEPAAKETSATGDKPAEAAPAKEAPAETSSAEASKADSESGEPSDKAAASATETPPNASSEKAKEPAIAASTSSSNTRTSARNNRSSRSGSGSRQRSRSGRKKK